jgi:hypothetical protein
MFVSYCPLIPQQKLNSICTAHLTTLSIARLHSVEWMNGIYSEGSECGLIEVLSQRYTGGTEEKHEKP